MEKGSPLFYRWFFFCPDDYMYRVDYKSQNVCDPLMASRRFTMLWQIIESSKKKEIPRSLDNRSFIISLDAAHWQGYGAAAAAAHVLF